MVARKHNTTLAANSGSSPIVEFHPKKLGELEFEELSLEDETQYTYEESDDSDLSSRAGKNFSPKKHISSYNRSTQQNSPTRPSIKPSTDSLKYISTSRRSWTSLPVPDMEKVKRSASLPHIGSKPQSKTKRRSNSLRFDTIQVRYFDQTLGDHPCTSYGPPISLDWKHEDGKTERVDDYERERGERRSLKGLMMNYYQRKNILMWQYGYSENDIKKATRETEKAAFQRSVTKYFLPVSKVEEAMQSAGRKARRAIGGGNKNDDTLKEAEVKTSRTNQIERRTSPVPKTTARTVRPKPVVKRAVPTRTISRNSVPDDDGLEC